MTTAESVYKIIKREITTIKETYQYNNISCGFNHFAAKLLFNVDDNDANNGMTDGCDDNCIDEYIVTQDSNGPIINFTQTKFPNSYPNCDGVSKNDVERQIDGFKSFIGNETEFNLKRWNSKLANKRNEYLGFKRVSKYRLYFISFVDQIFDGIEMIQNSIKNYGEEQGFKVELIFYIAKNITELFVKSKCTNWPSFSIKYTKSFNKQLASSAIRSEILYVSLYEYYLFLKSLNNSESLYEGNVRSYYQLTTINKSIISTIKNEPSLFHVLNGGITILCERMDNIANSKVSISSGSIVNGAQTSYCIYDTLRQLDVQGSNDLEQYKDSYVLVRLIEIQSNLELNNRISYSLNSINKMPVSYSIVNNINIRFLQYQFSYYGEYFLEVKRGESVYLNSGNKKIIRVEHLLQLYISFNDIKNKAYLVSNRKAEIFKDEELLNLAIERINYDDAIVALQCYLDIDAIRKQYIHNLKHGIQIPPTISDDVQDFVFGDYDYSYLVYGSIFALFCIGLYIKIHQCAYSLNVTKSIIDSLAKYMYSENTAHVNGTAGRTPLDYRNYLRKKETYSGIARFLSSINFNED